MSTLLYTEDLTKIYKTNADDVYALHKVNISINKGEFTILNGRSGSGKTTLINQLGVLDRATSGNIYLNDENISLFNERERDNLRRCKIGFVFQSVALMSLMTAYENVELALRISHYDVAKRRERTLECLDVVGLSNKAKHRPTQLSGGEQQRVAIARAIAHQPEIIFADEPTAELDTNTALTIVKLFKDLIKNQGATIVMTTHDPDMINIADNVFSLQDGEILHG